jgi:hypothetical protein
MRSPAPLERPYRRASARKRLCIIAGWPHCWPPSYSSIRELDYWGTSFREVALRLNDYAAEHPKRDDKIHLAVCGPLFALTPFLKPDTFEVGGANAPAELTVALNRGPCLQSLHRPWLFSVARGDLVFAAVARN